MSWQSVSLPVAALSESVLTDDAAGSAERWISGNFLAQPAALRQLTASQSSEGCNSKAVNVSRESGHVNRLSKSRRLLSCIWISRKPLFRRAGFSASPACRHLYTINSANDDLKLKLMVRDPGCPPEGTISPPSFSVLHPQQMAPVQLNTQYHTSINAREKVVQDVPETTTTIMFTTIVRDEISVSHTDPICRCPNCGGVTEVGSDYLVRGNHSRTRVSNEDAQLGLRTERFFEQCYRQESTQ
ncbi:hypothetical protein C8Q74DRAFT_1216655 [Fomes fomentarius]|nr:hypothetical protein C8Q74DRAFT_1216655 [Fomes fomentarius]